MCLTLSNINCIYSLFKKYHALFDSSRQSVLNLTDDIDYLNKDGQILSELAPADPNSASDI